MVSSSPESPHQLITAAILGPDFLRATFGGVVRGNSSSSWLRVVIYPVELRGRRHLQFSYFDERKDITKNFPADECELRLGELLAIGFANIHITSRREEIDIRITKKGKVLASRKPLAALPRSDKPQADRVPLPEGRADRVLEAMGILTREGRVRPTMRAKFTQINEFLKHFQHVLDDAELRSLGRPAEILDCGCGSSYLTLAAHHFLNDVLGIPARILGIDVNEEVIRKSIERAGRLGENGPAFSCAPIGAIDAKADVVLALHACDTATDDAIGQAIAADARLILSVPCCHHNLNDSIRSDGAAAMLRPMLRHGILQQRTADLVTDSFRALALRIMGYRTDVVEFVSPEHTARNLMIRATRGTPVGEAAFIREYLEMKRFWGVTPYIEGVLGERFGTLLRSVG